MEHRDTVEDNRCAARRPNHGKRPRLMRGFIPSFASCYRRTGVVEYGPRAEIPVLRFKTGIRYSVLAPTYSPSCEVPSAQMGLTSVFGMRTGVAPSPKHQHRTSNVYLVCLPISKESKPPSASRMGIQQKIQRARHICVLVMDFLIGIGGLVLLG